jgi:hypothetical protein
MRTRLPALAIAIALPLAACGSSGSGDKQAAAISGSTRYAQALKFSQCMRSHGLASFPDPQRNGGVLIQGGPDTGIDPRSPAFQSAQQACRKLLPGGGNPGQLSASKRAAALEFSQCMRAHGVPNFPDPSFSGGGAQLQLSRSSGIDPRSPAFQQAQKACGSPFGKGGPAPSARLPAP